MLSSAQIKQAITEGKIVIEPYDEKSVGLAGYDFRLGNKIMIPKAGQLIDFKLPQDPEYEEVEIGEEGFVLEPKMFVVAKTLEVVNLSEEISALIDGRLALAKLGISIHQADSFCDPGRKMNYTLEIFNAGVFRVKIYPGMRVGQLVFLRVDN